MLFKKRKKSWQRNRSFPKKRNAVKFLKRLATIIFIFLIIYFIFFSQFFLIKKIEIEGNKNILSDNIRETINNDISQPVLGFIPRNNFLLTKDEEIETLLLNKFSEIKVVEVNKKFPNSLKIKITEKNPLIIWCRLEDCYYLDNNGVAFLSADKNLLTEKDSKFIKIMEQLEIEEETEDKIETNKAGILEDKKKNDVTYKLSAEQFERVRLFFVGEETNDWVSTYPVLFAVAGKDFGLPVLTELSGRDTKYSLSFAKKMIDDLKRIEVCDDEKIFQIRINFNFENESIFINVIERKKEEERIAAVFEPIKINDEVSDSDFINFAIRIDKEIKNKTTLNINYYKTKGTGSRELIAYTDKNTRVYFNTTDDADLQVNYLKDFLSKGIDRKKIDALEYIYLKSGNKIFYK
ncbi:MAG: FtsQ-type POTRA domain-containing protein [Candidatus Pacebacteria bacterium]|nr:FtsQ-type POTRA domain-containing protein [Candidatus Paceibacterota bacterium]